MAAAGAPLPPWDPHNTEEAALIYRSDLDKALDKAGPTLAANLQLDDIWLHLRQLQVLELTDEERIKHCEARPDQVSSLLSFIKKGPRWKYHGLMRAMVLTGQTHLIPKGGPDPEVYMDQAVTSSTEEAVTSSPEAEDTREPLGQDLLRIIYDHCKYNKRCLKRVHIFAFDGDPGDDYIDITPCYINVDPKMKYQKMAMVPIAATKILEKIGDSDPPLVVRLYGQPGDGKTSFTMNIAYSWSVAFMEQVTKKDGKLSLKSKCPLWTTMVFIKARNITKTVEDAILEELGCKSKDREKMMAHVRNGEGVAVLIEAMDELHDPEAIQKLKEYVKECKRSGGPTVLITSRTDLCDIDGTDFDRFLTLEGFSEEQALQYVKLYTESCKVPEAPHSPLPSHVYDHVTTHKGKLKAVLSNPLQLHIYCALVMRGEIKLSRTGKLSMPQLFGVLETYLLRREGHKPSQQQSNDFYRFCMHAILNDLREFPRALLDEFNISESYYVFLNKSDRRGPDGGLEAYYSFGHEVVLEYFASRYIYSLNSEEQSSFLLLACCDESWENIQNIVFQMLVEEGHDQIMLMQTMIRSILILQYKGSCEDGDKTIHDLMHLREQIVLPSKDIFLSRLGQISIENVAAIHEKINNVFDNQPELLRAANWLDGVHWSFRHVVQCIRTCPPDIREVLIKNSILCLMPGKYSTFMSSENWYFPVGGARWADVHVNDKGRVKTCSVAAWSPTDAADAILQFTTMSSDEPLWGVNRLDLTEYGCQDVLELPDVDVWSKEHWDKVLHVILQGIRVSLRISVPSTAPLTGLLLSLVENAHKLSECKTVCVERGAVEFNKMLKAHYSCKQAGVELQFNNAYIFVSENIGPLDTLVFKQWDDISQESAVKWVHGSWTNDIFRMTLKKQASLTDLLSHLLDNCEHLSQCKEISVQSGTAKLEELMTWLSQCTDAGLKLNLPRTCIELESLVQNSHDFRELLSDATLARGEVSNKIQLSHAGHGQDQLSIRLKAAGPLVGLLSYLTDHAVQFSKYRVSVSGGAAEVQNLIACLSRSKQHGLPLKLYNTSVIVSSAWRKQEGMHHQSPNNCPKEALQMEMIHTHADGLSFWIAKDSTLSPIGLLSHLPHCIDRLSQQDIEIFISGGRANLVDMMHRVTKCHQAGVNLDVYGIFQIRRTPTHQEISAGECPAHVEVNEWNSDYLEIKVEETTPLTGLLSYLHEHAADMPVVKRIIVFSGTIELPDMVLWISKFEKSGPYLKFCKTDVALPKRLLAIEDTLDGLQHPFTTNNPVEVTLKGNSMIFALPETAPLTGLLSWLIDQAAHLSQFHRIIMKDGTADLDDLMSLLFRCKETRLGIDLVNVHIVLSDRTNDQECRTSPLKNTDVQKGHLQLESGKLRITLDETSSHTLLQACLLQHAAHLSQYSSIMVGGGKADLGDLLTWVSQCRNLGLKVELGEVYSKTIEQSFTEQCDLNTDTLNITVDRTTPLTDVVSSLLEKAASLPQCRFITVHSGTATLTELLTWVTEVTDKHLRRPRFKFYDTNVIVAETGSNVMLKELTHDSLFSYSMRICAKATPLTHLLPCLLDNAVQLSQSRSIVIENAKAPLIELLSCMSRCKQEGLYYLIFRSIHIIMPKKQATEGDKLRGQFQNGGLKLKTVLCTEREIFIDSEDRSTCQVTDLLLQFPECCADLSKWKLIRVERGNADLGELNNCIKRCQQNGLELELSEILLSRTLNHELYENAKAERYRSELRVGEWYRGCLELWAGGKISLIHLLSFLHDHASSLSSVREIAVSGCTIELDHIVPWLCKYEEAGLTLTLPETMILIPEKLKSSNENHCEKSVKTQAISPVVIREWVGGCLQIDVDETILLTGLLSHFHQHAAELCSSVTKLCVSNGLVDLADVLPWISKLELAGIELTWRDTQVFVHEMLKAEADAADEPEITPAVRPLEQDPLMGWGTYHPEFEIGGTSLKTAPTLNPVVKKWSRQIVSINLLEATPLDHFLEWLRKEAKDLSHCRRIIVEYGTTEMDNLLTQLSWYYFDGLNVEVKNFSVARQDQDVTLNESNVLKLQNFEIVGDKVMIDLAETTSLTCLMSCLVNLAPRLSWYDSIDIRYGTALLVDLLTCTSNCTKAGLKLELYDTCVLLSKSEINHEDEDPQAVSVPDSGKTGQARIGLSDSKWSFPGLLPLWTNRLHLRSNPDEEKEPQTKIVCWLDDTLTIDLDWLVSVTDLLSVLLVQAVHLTQCQCIRVLHGTAELEALMDQVYKCRQAGLKLELSNTYITGLDNIKYQTNFYGNRIHGIRTQHKAKQGMDLKWANNSLTLILPTATPLTDLLSGLLNQPVHLEKCKEITVKYGTAELGDLMTCVSRYDNKGLRLKLYKPYVIVSDKPIDKDQRFKWRLIEDPEIWVRLDGWEIHTVLF